MKDLIKAIDAMKSHRVRNYVIAGLDSYLLENGKVRVFENARNHQDQITPHSHRFDFTCLVLRGWVKNKVWHEAASSDADEFVISEIAYSGKIGSHEKEVVRTGKFLFKESTYTCGNTYSMKKGEIHSITFSRGAVVLFFEGPEQSDKSLILEPIVDGLHIQTYESKSYMFLRSGPV